MDTPPKTPKAGLEDEKAFSETLLTDHGLTEQPEQPGQPELLPEPARLADVATGLQAAHELGMIHRNIKPSNILVTRNGHGKISDFGLVRVDDPNDPFDTYAHQSVGTPFYIAPEMIRHQTIGPAVDIYSLGSTLYHLLTGRPPYTAEKMEEVLRQHLHAEIPNLQQVLPDCSPSLAVLVQRMMSKEPHLRPSAAEAAAMLHAESIALFPDAAGISGPGGSSVTVPWQGMPDKTRPPLSDTTILMSDAPRWKRLGYFLTRLSTLWRVVLTIVLLLVLGGLAFRLYSIKNPPRQDRRLVSRLFPQAPAGYGAGNTEMMQAPLSLRTEVPGFSWVGKVDASTCRYLASRSGRYFYPIDDKRAVLIRADQFVGYQTAEEALQDGKQPAP